MSDYPLSDYDGEIFLYYGDISREGYAAVSDAFEKTHEKLKKVCLILITRGGDPDAAYRIARATRHHFDVMEILIPDICKSAGTLLCIGADRLIFGDRGELGPLDIQLSKPDEMLESMSGLDILQAISALEDRVLQAFRTYLIDIRFGSQIRTKTAAEIATKLADGFIAPIAARIDPITLGEHQRAMQIAYDYGERLNNTANSLKKNALIKLVSSYPSHGFVIDRKEAGGLFKNVVAPDSATEEIYIQARKIVENFPYPSTPLVIDVRETLSQSDEQTEAENVRQPEGAGNQGNVAGDDGTSERESAEIQQNAQQSDQSGDNTRKRRRSSPGGKIDKG